MAWAQPGADDVEQLRAVRVLQVGGAVAESNLMTDLNSRR